MIGAHMPRMLRLAARHADLWNGFACNNMERLGPVLQAVDVACAQEGRDPATLRRTAGVLVDLPAAYEAALGEGYRRFRSAVRPPGDRHADELAECLRTFGSAGVSHL
jgi:alkanesulfonate monooxygenase SsuD/methylene tetrahydromethanopterin reductase-like flavin-dependent oxidoreductase (luciferase family)